MPCGLPEAQQGAWRLLRALVISRHDDITGEDSSLWEALNRVLDDAVDGCDVRPLTATLAVNLGALTDRASRHAQSALTESARLRARVLLREVSERLRLDTLDIGLLRRLAWMTQEVVDELPQQASSALTSMPAAARPTAHSPMPANWAASA